MVQFLNVFWSRDEYGQIFVTWEFCYDLMMQFLHKLLLNLALAGSLLVLLYALFTVERNVNSITDVTRNDESVQWTGLKHDHRKNYSFAIINKKQEHTVLPTIHLWCILTKVDVHFTLKIKFQDFIDSVFKYHTTPLTFHIITDDQGQRFAEDTYDSLLKHSYLTLKMQFYHVSSFAEQLQPIVFAMQPHFSSSPGSYYSDSLFFLSLGIHKIAPKWMSKCILVDIDTQFRADPYLLWSHFNNFSSTQLVGLAPELSPVYRHTLYIYRSSKFANKKIGEPHSQGGYSGLNSGAVLLNLKRLRESKKFLEVCKADSVTALAKKYKFRGHLGDQDFYTLLGIEHPELIYLLPCVWNRQLCTWWKENGYSDIFHEFFKCNGQVQLYHGNCNTRIPPL